MATRQMALTPSLVAQIHRVVEDPGPDPNVVYHTEEDYDALVRHLLLSHRPDQDRWLFAYGSLIWKSEVDHIEERIGTAHGWHRAFRLRITRWRASADQPGLMMGLDRGGQCRGALFRITAPSVEENLGKLVRCEMSAKPPTNVARWIRVETNMGPVRALAFALNRKGRVYAGKLSPRRPPAFWPGHVVIGARAPSISTVMHLEERGIHDSNLWRLQALVAERLKAASSGCSPVP